jgi:hypothetical protein
MSNQNNSVPTNLLNVTFPIFSVGQGERGNGTSAKGSRVTDVPNIGKAVTVGEDGRGRRLGILPVRGEDTVGVASISCAAVQILKSGRYALSVPHSRDIHDDHAIVVIRIYGGYRGNGTLHSEDGGPFPYPILCEGYAAEGDAGRMGDSRQVVALVPRSGVWLQRYSGRTYGGPKAHYGCYDGGEILLLTPEERELCERF